ncbi:MAG: glutamate cyclase domain-containing protein, partial [Pseudomonadota bacterium]
MTRSEDLALSRTIEDILVARNLRGMKTVQPHLERGYCLRAAEILRNCRGNVLIGTGFPVVKTFETD